MRLLRGRNSLLGIWMGLIVGILGIGFSLILKIPFIKRDIQKSKEQFQDQADIISQKNLTYTSGETILKLQKDWVVLYIIMFLFFSALITYVINNFATINGLGIEMAIIFSVFFIYLIYSIATSGSVLIDYKEALKIKRIFGKVILVPLSKIKNIKIIWGINQFNLSTANVLKLQLAEGQKIRLTLDPFLKPEDIKQLVAFLKENCSAPIHSREGITRVFSVFRSKKGDLWQNSLKFIGAIITYFLLAIFILRIIPALLIWLLR